MSKQLQVMAQHTKRQASGDTPMQQTYTPLWTPMQQTCTALSTRMQHVHIPFSRFALKLDGRTAPAYWSADGKRPMYECLPFMSIAYKKHDQNEYANHKLQNMKNALGTELTKHIHNLGDDTPDCMYLDGLKFLVSKMGSTKEFALHNAAPFRRDLLSTLTAFENGDTATWPAGMVFMDTSALINITNRQAAATLMQSKRVDEVVPVPVRQKKVALLPTFPFKVASAGSSGASSSSAPSAASAMQVRLLV